MTVFICLLASLFISGCLGLFMLVLVAHSLIQQEKYYHTIEEEMDEHFNALADKIDKDYEALLRKIDKDYDKIIKK